MSNPPTYDWGVYGWVRVVTTKIIFIVGLTHRILFIWNNYEVLIDEQNQNWGTSLDKLIWTTNFGFYSIKIQLDLSLTVTDWDAYASKMIPHPLQQEKRYLHRTVYGKRSYSWITQILAYFGGGHTVLVHFIISKHIGTLLEYNFWQKKVFLYISGWIGTF